MTEKIFIQRQDGLPCPCINPESAQALADWYHQQLQDALDRGERTLRLNCFDCPGGTFSPAAGAYTVLKMAVDFLYGHPEIQRLDLLCDGAACHRAYRFQWNMWFAETKPHDD